MITRIDWICFFFFFFFFSFFFFFLCVPQLDLWGSPFWVRFLCLWLFFFSPNHWSSHFRLRGWCMLGVLVAGTHPPRTWTSGSFESVRWNACVHRLDLGLYSHPKEFRGIGVRTHVNSKGKIPSTGNILPRGGSNPRHCIKQDSEPSALPRNNSGARICLIMNLKLKSVWGFSSNTVLKVRVGWARNWHLWVVNYLISSKNVSKREHRI